MQNPAATVVLGDSRLMNEAADDSVGLVITSPPYWQIKDYGAEHQIGYGQTLHEYLTDLYRVWRECHRALRPGRRLCINVGDQFARQSIYGRYKVIPIHAEMISQCESIGFDYMGSIIWQKKTTVETSGGAVVMGSYPYPPNGIVELDYEFILLFKKPGESARVDPAMKAASQMTKEEWKTYFQGHWTFGGVRQRGHEAMFPEELPRRLIRMFTFAGDLVLDPFLGSGTTAKAAVSLERRAIGYEIRSEFIPLIKDRLGADRSPVSGPRAEFIVQDVNSISLTPISYVPSIQDAAPLAVSGKSGAAPERLHKVISVNEDASIEVNSGLRVHFLGVQIRDLPAATRYLQESILGKQVYLRHDEQAKGDAAVDAYVYLKNRIFINSYLIRSGLAVNDKTRSHRLSRKFEAECKTAESITSHSASCTAPVK